MFNSILPFLLWNSLVISEWKFLQSASIFSVDIKTGFSKLKISIGLPVCLYGSQALCVCVSHALIFHWRLKRQAAVCENVLQTFALLSWICEHTHTHTESVFVLLCQCHTCSVPVCRCRRRCWAERLWWSLTCFQRETRRCWRPLRSAALTPMPRPAVITHCTWASPGGGRRYCMCL